MTHFASFTAAAQLHFGIVTDAGAISMNAAFPQFSSLQDVVIAGALKDLAKAPTIPYLHMAIQNN